MPRKRKSSKAKAPVIVDVGEPAKQNNVPVVAEIVVPAPVVVEKGVAQTPSSPQPVPETTADENGQATDSSNNTTATSSGSSSSSSSSPRSSNKDPKWGNIESMATIEKSPYEPSLSAEVGEAMFDEMKSLLVHASDDGKLNPKACKLFGNRLAESLVQANIQIGISGILFSPSWQEGKIRGVQCGWIPKALLLLCLHEQRFTRNTEDAVLLGIIKDLGVTRMVGDAMQEWGLESQYLPLVASLGSFSFTRQKLASYKCAIFVARAYRCFKALKHTTVSDSLMTKIKRCLDIMNQNIKVIKRELARLEAELEKKEKQEAMRQTAQQSQDITSIASATSAATTNATTAGAGCTEAEVSSLEPSSTSSRKRSRNQDRDQSLTALLSTFEEQYKKMGETLAIMRKKVQQREQEISKGAREKIRAEILEEIQQSSKGRNSYGNKKTKR